MIPLIIVFYSLAFAGMVAAVYILIRNEMVYRFRTMLNERCYDVSMANLSLDCYTEVYDRLPRYSAMVMSFKPLKPEYWLTQHQRNLLNL